MKKQRDARDKSPLKSPRKAPRKSKRVAGQTTPVDDLPSMSVEDAIREPQVLELVTTWVIMNVQADDEQVQRMLEQQASAAYDALQDYTTSRNESQIDKAQASINEAVKIGKRSKKQKGGAIPLATWGIIAGSSVFALLAAIAIAVALRRRRAGTAAGIAAEPPAAAPTMYAVARPYSQAYVYAPPVVSQPIAIPRPAGQYHGRIPPPPPYGEMPSSPSPVVAPPLAVALARPVPILAQRAAYTQIPIPQGFYDGREASPLMRPLPPSPTESPRSF